MMKKNNVENQAFKRLNATYSAKLKKSDEECPMAIQNISGQGIEFQTQKFLQPADKITIIVSLTNKDEPLVLT